MFNPKENLLDQQLAVSGLEMHITWAGVSAIASVAGGLFGASQASKSNRSAAKARRRQEELNEKQANISNEYNRETFEAERNDYYAARQFQYDTAVKQWQYDTEIQDFRYLQDVKAYGKSVENYGQQLVYNNMAYQSAKESQMAAYNETLDAAAFEKQGLLVEQLQAEGRASMGQAGTSRGKAIQAVASKYGRDLAVLRATLTSSQKELQRSLMDTALQKYGADMQAKANLMIRPDRLPELVKPELGPARTFVEPAEVLPGAVPPVQRQSTIMPLIGAVAGVANTFAGGAGFWNKT
jgi:hypothetical protein